MIFLWIGITYVVIALAIYFIPAFMTWEISDLEHIAAFWAFIIVLFAAGVLIIGPFIGLYELHQYIKNKANNRKMLKSFPKMVFQTEQAEQPEQIEVSYRDMNCQSCGKPVSEDATV